eukprot:COSAG02_NODE_2927_length_7713_cov_98.281590_1_plen_44_part_00
MAGRGGARWRSRVVAVWVCVLGGATIDVAGEEVCEAAWLFGCV